MNHHKLILLCAVCSILIAAFDVCWATEGTVLSGELKKWHRITLTFTGPDTRENAEPNPFLDYRLNVTFARGRKRYVVAGYYAADGNAGQTSASSGNKWRVHFVPDEEGRWSYTASFHTGRDVALSSNPAAGSATAFDGARGRFRVGPSDKTGRDHRAKGLLKYVGKHYLQFAETGEYFLKGGADSPENFLAYDEIDGTYDADAGSGSYSHIGGFIHKYGPHLQDWRPGDPTWKDGKGKGIIGALNYLASEGMNSVYFLTYNIDGGDGRDTWMWTTVEERERFDCSKLDQWEIIFDHMDRLGIMLHVVTQETENDHKLGGSAGLNPIRKLYYRELAARFSHHLAVMWNLGEENNTLDADRKEIAAYIRSLDPYSHPITVHTKSGKALQFYDGILGDPSFEATSIQGDMANYNKEAIVLRKRSADAGRKWAIFGDEQSKASHGVVPDADDPTHDIPRKQGLWGNLMGGGSGVEWYFGHQFPHMDINCEDWRTRDCMWDQTRYALEFFREHLPFTEMVHHDELTSVRDDYCFAKVGQIYAIYLPAGGTTSLDLGASSATFTLRWYNPRTGGPLRLGTVGIIAGPGSVAIGHPPATASKDWVALIKRQ